MLIDKTPSRESRFLAKVNKTDSCWEWTGCLSTTGYGRFGTSKQVFYVHRIAYEWYNGDLDPKDVVRHVCDNPKCVNPEHLSIGSHKDNMQDMVDRGRHIGAREIDPTEVIKIRERRHAGETANAIAESYGFHPQHIRAICAGRFWPNVGGPLTKRKFKNGR